MTNLPPQKDPAKRSTSKSGMFPRPSFDLDAPNPQGRREAPPPPLHLPEQHDAGATTGMMPVVSEGEDSSAERDNDRVSGGV